MATKTKKKQETGNELLESSEAIAEQVIRGEQFIEKNKKMVFIIGGMIAVVIAAFFLYDYYKTTQNEKAIVDVFQAQYYFEQDSLDKALSGDGNNFGFLDIIDEYPMSESANLANFYAGVIYIKKGEYELAIEYLNHFSGDDLLVTPRAYSLIGDANMELGNYDEAISHYEKAALYNPNDYTSPIYMSKAAIAYEKSGNLDGAIKAYETIIKNHRESAEYPNALKQKARLEMKKKAG